MNKREIKKFEKMLEDEWSRLTTGIRKLEEDTLYQPATDNTATDLTSYAEVGTDNFERETALRVASDHPGLTLAVVAQKQGFWFGNPMWLATVAAASDAAPGLYSVTVRAPQGAADAPAQAFFLQVFPDKAAQDAAKAAVLAGRPSLSQDKLFKAIDELQRHDAVQKA